MRPKRKNETNNAEESYIESNPTTSPNEVRRRYSDYEEQACNMELRELLNETQAARVLGISPQTLRRGRMLGRNIRKISETPPFVRVSARAIRYRQEDLLNWIEARRVDRSESMMYELEPEIGDPNAEIPSWAR